MTDKDKCIINIITAIDSLNDFIISNNINRPLFNTEAIDYELTNASGEDFDSEVIRYKMMLDLYSQEAKELGPSKTLSIFEPTN